jgi:capsular exopolysaccharide synthesis family protein
MQTDNPIRQTNVQQEISYRKLLQIIGSRWYWIAGTTILCLLIGLTYIWYTVPIYSTQAALKFEERRSEISELMNVRPVYDRSDKLLSEQFVIRSREVLLNAIKRMNYPISFDTETGFRTKDCYPARPLEIQTITAYKVKGHFRLKPTSDSTFMLNYNAGTGFSDAKSQAIRKYRLNDTIQMGGAQFKILKLKNLEPVLFHFNEPEELLARVDAGLKMNENKNTNILTFNQIDQNAAFGRDFLNSLLEEYVQYDRAQKTKSASQTIAFINRLQLEIASVVKHSGSSFEQFKVNTQMLDIPGATKKVTEQLQSLEKEMGRLKLERLMILQLQADMLNNKNVEAINLDLQGALDPSLNSLLGQLNMLLTKKQQQLITYKPSALAIQEIDNQLRMMKQSIVRNLQAQLVKNNKATQFIAGQTNTIRSSFNQIPKAEKEFVNLQSAFEVNQKVYAYLSEKKLEAQISKAAVIPGVIIVDRATLTDVPLQPVPQSVFTTSLLLGLSLGVGLIFLVRLTNPYIHDVERILRLTETPVVGVIRKLPSALDRASAFSSGHAMDLRQAIFQESVRAVRTSISYLAADTSCKVICITSEISNEGKSFTALQLARTLSLLQKRVVIIAADLRKSTLHERFNLTNHVGLSSFLSGEVPKEQIIMPTGMNEVYLVPAGPVPVNPSELLHAHRMRDFLAELKSSFDYIVVDCAPIGLVSDAIPLIKVSDINLFVIRAKVSKFSAALIPDALSREFGLSNMAIVLNAFENDLLYTSCYKEKISGSGHYNAYQPRQYYDDAYLGGMSAKRKFQFWRTGL